MYIMGIDPTTGQTSAQGPAFRVGSLGAVVEAPGLYTAPMSGTGTTAGQFDGTKVFVYVSAGAGITAGQAVQINYENEAVPTGALASSTGYRVGVATCDIESGGFGWVQVFGKADVNVVASTAVGGAVSTSGTAGSLDDLTAGAGLRPVTGLHIGAVDGTTGSVYLNWPVQGAAFS